MNVMAHKKKNMEIKKRPRTKKGFHPDPCLRVSKEELDELMKRVLVNQTKDFSILEKITEKKLRN